MSYKERFIETIGYSRLGTEVGDGVGLQRDVENGRTIKDDAHERLVPFHAVDRVIASTRTITKDDKNPYGCEADGGDSPSGGCTEVFARMFMAQDTGEGFASTQINDVNPTKPDALTITINGTTYNDVPKQSFGGSTFYGAQNPTFEEYPFIISIPNNGAVILTVPRAGMYSVLAEDCTESNA